MDVVEDALAAYRLTRLVTTDVVTTPVRDAVIRWAYRDHPPAGWALTPTERVALDDDPPPVAKLVTCSWCAGVWVGAGVVVAAAVAPRTWRHARRALACAAVAGWLSARE